MRLDYKSTWNKLSADFDKAIRHVTGTATEKELLQSGIHDAERIIKHTQTTINDEVLEIGCGVGRIGLEYSNHCKTWTGADISSNMLEFASQRLQHKENINFKELTGCDLSIFEDNTFDVIYCSVVFMHLDEWDRYHYINETYRVLNSRGRAYFDNFNLQSKEGWNTFMDHKEIPADNRPAHISKSSTKNEFEAYFKNSEFEKFVVITDGQWVVGKGEKT